VPRGSEGGFAVALVKDTVFRVLWFPYHGDRYGQPIEVAQAGWFRRAHLAVSGDTVRVAPFRSDFIWDFVWSDSARKFLLVDDLSTSSP
jgi:hypothetical protein